MGSIGNDSTVEREGLQAALVLGTWAYLVLLISHMWVAVAWPVWLNRLLSLSFFLTVYRKFWLGQIRPGQMAWWTFALSAWMSLGMALTYIQGASPYVGVRFGFLMIVAALFGLPWRLHLALILLGGALTAFLQLAYPSATDPALDLVPTLVYALFSLQAHRARMQVFENLARARQQLRLQAAVLEENRQTAVRLQHSLDQDVAYATRHLEETNGRLQAAIEEQIQSFHRNQQLRQETADLLCNQSLGRAAGGAAHDFNNLLAVISGTLELHQQDLCAQPDSRLAFETICSEVDRAIVVGRRVLAVSGRQILRPENLQVHLLLPAWVADWSGRFPGLRLLPEVTATASRCDPTELHHILEGLILNAAEATAQDAPIFLRLLPDRLLLVEDTGAALSASLQSQLFRPFFTTHSDYQHLGLSLAASRASLRQQGGDLSYRASPTPHFRIQLP